MQWEDEGFLLTKNKFSENSLIVEIFTLHHGKSSGLVYGGTSRKIKNYLQVGNKLHAKLKAKNDTKMGYFQIEIIDPISPYFFNNYQKLNCLLSSINILKTTLPESQSYKKIYTSFDSFLHKLKYNDNWIFDYIFWEIDLLKELGFDMNLKPSSVSKYDDGKNMFYITIDNEEKKLPIFLINRNIENIDKNYIYLALNFLSNFLEKNILIPNNLSYSRARKKLENYFRY